MYAEPQIAHFIEPYLARLWFQPSEELVTNFGYIIALGSLTFLHVVVGEMVPKSLALSDAAKMALLLAQPMRIASAKLLLYYPVKFLNWIGAGLLKLFRVPPAEGHARVLSSEEIELIVAESTEGGLLNEEEQEMIMNIFEFSDRVVEQVMTPRRKVEAVPHNISQDALLKFVVASRHTRFPVYEEDRDHVVGVLHLKDLMHQTLRSEGPFDIDLLLRDVPAVPEDYPIERLLLAFKKRKLHLAVVLDEFGGMAGIVTLEDLVEEIVGEVRDEFDLEKEPYVEISPGVVEVAGSYLVDDFDEGFWGSKDDLPDVETVGGLVVAKLGRPPKVGDEVTYNGWVRMKVLAVDGRAVARVCVEFPDPEKNDTEETAAPEQIEGTKE
jgi:CBS domain containing-hemolysin-like protein